VVGRAASRDLPGKELGTGARGGAPGSRWANVVEYVVDAPEQRVSARAARMAQDIDVAAVLAARLDHLACSALRIPAGQALVRFRTLTLLIRAPDKPSAEAAVAVAAEAARHFPGRVIVVVASARRRSRGLETRVAFHDGLEVIWLLTRSHASLADLTRPLWLPGLPCVTWWLGRPPTLQEMQGTPRWLIVDSAAPATGQRDRSALATLASAGQTILDLSREQEPTPSAPVLALLGRCLGQACVEWQHAATSSPLEGIMSDVATEIRTGQRAPVSGIYECVRHTGQTDCTPTDKERRVRMAAGEPLPPIRSCGEDAIWRLAERA
jgi:hypothetical protein